MAPTFKLIASSALTTSAASVTFSNIPQSYTDLIVRFSLRSSTGTFSADLNGQLNGSSASEYSTTQLSTFGGAPQSTKLSSRTVFEAQNDVQPSGSTANTFGSGEIYITNYAGSTNKQFSHFINSADNGASFIGGGGYANVSTLAHLWRNTSAITSLVLSSGNNFASGSTFYLYGIKNS